jgi:hypothetical protein
MASKYKIPVKVAGTDVIDYAGDADFTTDAILCENFEGFTLNFWFQVLNGVSPKPRITIQVSNTDNINSFVTYVDVDNIAIPQLFEKSSIGPRYIRFIYDSTDVGVGSVITIDFYKKKL